MRKRQPYLKLYVQDFLSDEKLNECSAEATGVYIRLMCIMHKNEEYGVIRLKPKDKHTGKVVADLARKLARQMPYEVKVIERSLDELLDEGVLSLDGELLYQKRMVHDGKVSAARAAASQQRWQQNTRVCNTASSNFESDFAYANAKQIPLQKCDIDSDSDNDYESDTEDESENVEITSAINVGENLTRAHVREGSPEPGSGDPALARVFGLYQDIIGVNMSSAAARALIDYTRELGADVVCKAIDMAVDYGARNWAYINGILRNFQAEGIRSLADIEQREADRIRRGKGKRSAVHSGPLDVIDEMLDEEVRRQP